MTSNVIGRRFGRRGFVRRHDRSAAGSVAFVVTAIPAALGAYLFVASEPVNLALAASAAGIAGLTGAIVELLVPPGLDDNLAIAITSGAAFSCALVALA